MFTVYSKDNCPWCVKAFALLDSKGEDYVVNKLVTDEEKHAFVALGYKQVPQIFYNGELIPGGYTGLVLWYADKEADEDSAFDE